MAEVGFEIMENLTMNKLIISLLICSILLTVAFGESIDWSQYPDDELESTIAELTTMLESAKAELSSRDGDNTVDGVRVPIGVWYIGEDIPAGHYTINVAPDQYMVWGSIKVGTVLDDTGKDINRHESEYYYYEQVRLKGSKAAVSQDEIDYDFKDGGILIVEYADMLFTPYVKPKLGF